MGSQSGTTGKGRGGSPVAREQRTLAPEQTRKLAARIEEIVTEHESESAAARALGLAQQTINRIRRKDSAVGLHVARQIAEYDGLPLVMVLQGVPKAFGEAIRGKRGHWARWTLHAVYEVAVAESGRAAERTAGQWAALLDEVERTLGPVMRAPPSKRL